MGHVLVVDDLRNVRTTLESLATRAGVKIESMEPQASPSNEQYRETKVEVSLKGVSLPQTVTYLHEIETSRDLLAWDKARPAEERENRRSGWSREREREVLDAWHARSG